MDEDVLPSSVVLQCTSFRVRRSLIDCSARMLLMSPRDEEADIRNGYDPQSEPGERTRSELGDTYEACVRMSEQWAARGNVTSLLGPL
jgi:hypothetical protein